MATDVALSTWAPPSFQELPEEALLKVLLCFCEEKRRGDLATLCHLIRQLLLHPALWRRLDLSTWTVAGRRKLHAADALRMCDSLRVCRIGPEVEEMLLSKPPPLRSLELCYHAGRDSGDNSEIDVEPLLLKKCSNLSRLLLVRRPDKGIEELLSMRQLKILHVQTSNMAFRNLAGTWLQEGYCLEELCCVLARKDENVHAAYMASLSFLQQISQGLTKDFVERRRKFRVSLCRLHSLPETMAVRCGLCGAALFSEETIYLLAPGTQFHIDCEVYVWGSSRCSLTLLPHQRYAHNCQLRCHEAERVFLVAERGSFIKTHGFSYAIACGRSLSCLTPRILPQRFPFHRFWGSKADDGWFKEFLADLEKRGVGATTHIHMRSPAARHALRHR